MNYLLNQINKCSVCSSAMGHAARPILSVHPKSKIAIIGQAPGSIVHRTGVPWDDQSGKNLREWLGVNPETFYDEKKFALIPMSFCYPGKGKSGDLPPRKECAPLWHAELFSKIEDLRLVILIHNTRQKTLLD